MVAATDREQALYREASGFPPVMEIVAEMPGSKLEGFLAAGHAAALTGWFDDRR